MSNESLFSFEFCETDEEWIKWVFIYYANYCAWPSCGSVFGLGAHHIIPRGIQALRLLAANGVLLCAKHHDKVESMKGTRKYARAMTLLIGQKRWELLKQREKKAIRGSTATTSGMDLPTSEIGF